VYFFLPGNSSERAVDAAKMAHEGVPEPTIAEVNHLLKEGKVVLKYLDSDNVVKTWSPR